MEILYSDSNIAVCVKPVGLDSEAEVPAALKEALAEEKPLILLMHIPFGVEGNIHMLRGCGEYFCLNYDDSCPAENHEFVRLIQENHHRIVAVLTGHLHFNHTCPIAGDLSLYGTSQGMAGQINRYVIGE